MFKFPTNLSFVMGILDRLATEGPAYVFMGVWLLANIATFVYHYYKYQVCRHAVRSCQIFLTVFL